MSADYSSFTNADLDQAYAANDDAMNAATGAQKIMFSQQRADMEQEILTRLASVTSFVFGAFGGINFPLYNSIQSKKAGGFVQSEAAQSAITTTVTNDVKAIQQTASDALSIFGKWTKIIALVVVGIVVLIVFLKFGKRAA